MSAAYERLNRKNRKISMLAISLSCFGIAWAGSLPFILDGWGRLAAGALGGSIIALALRRWFGFKRDSLARDHLKWIIEHLDSRLSAGATLESAFSGSSARLEILLGNKSPVRGLLVKIEAHLAARRPLDALLPDLGRALSCPEAAMICSVLPLLRQAGGDVRQYIRRQLVMLNEKGALLREMDSTTAQRQTEAMILSVMPFVMAAMLQTSVQIASSGTDSSVLIKAGLFAAYGLAILAIPFILVLTSPDIDGQCRTGNPSSHMRNVRLQLLNGPAHLLQKAYRQFLPEILTNRFFSTLVRQAQEQCVSAAALLEFYFTRKTLYLATGLLLSLVITVADPSLFWCLLVMPAAISGFQDRQIILSARQRQEDTETAFPDFLNTVTSLLQSGITLHNSLNIFIMTCPRQHVKKLNLDIESIVRKADAGIPVESALEEAAANCAISHVQSALLMIVRHARDGGKANLELLNMQSNVCWSIYKQTTQKRLERRSLGLLLPMMLDLLSVMLTAILPAIQSLHSI